MIASPGDFDCKPLHLLRLPDTPFALSLSRCGVQNSRAAPFGKPRAIGNTSSARTGSRWQFGNLFHTGPFSRLMACRPRSFRPSSEFLSSHCLTVLCATSLWPIAAKADLIVDPDLKDWATERTCSSFNE